jgi:L-histidine N-alpha-methyltransferase
MNQTIDTITQFEEEVLKGLNQPFKSLPSKYFYDTKGDQLFQQIMQLDEYYLTRKELSIFKEQCAAIYDAIDDGRSFRIIELGAGDGLKTKVLLKYFVSQGADFTYSPVDISANVLAQLEMNLMNDIPSLKYEAFVGDYFDALSDVAERPHRDVVFFLGSNVGNFPKNGEVEFLQKLSSYLNAGDLLLMGADLKKNPYRILDAYNDKDGITREFNLNLLDRMNTEIGCTFDRDSFEHYPTYNPQSGECHSYLISKVKQTVQVGSTRVDFEEGEAILMEVSKKFDQSSLEDLAKRTGFSEKEMFTDKDGWFADLIWEKT